MFAIVRNAAVAYGAASLLIVFLAASTPSGAQQIGDPIAIRAGESIDVTEVYWIQDCRSLLKGFGGVEILKGGLPGLTLTIRPEHVYARRQNCRDKVPGGTVVAHAGDVDAAHARGVVEFRVLYDTDNGPRESLHRRLFVLYQAATPQPSASPPASASPGPTSSPGR